METREKYEANKAAYIARQKKESEAPKREPWWFNQPLAIDRFTGWLMAYTLILAVATIVSGYILYITNQTSQATNRAFVNFGDAKLIPYPNKSPVTYAIIGNVANGGNTPARNVRITFSCPARESDKKNIDPYDLEPLKSRFDPPTFIGPKQEVTLIFCQIPLTLLSDLKKGVERFVVAEVRYADVFEISKTRVTQMTRFITYDDYGGIRLGFIGRHNCSDEDCPP